MPDKESISYEEYCTELEKTYGKEQIYLLFTARIDSVYGMEPDFAFLKEDAYQDAFDTFMENMEACDNIGGVTESEFATIALCSAIVEDCTIDKRVVSPAELFDTLVSQVGSGLYSNAPMIALMSNNGRSNARDLWKKRDFKKMAEIINSVYGRMTNDWKETYDSKGDVNSKSQINKRLLLGFLSLKLIDVVLKNTDLLAAVNQKKMENGLIMAEKVNMYLESAKAKILIASHGEPHFNLTENDSDDSENGKNVSASCEFADGFILSDNDFAMAQLTIVLPYLYDTVNDRAFSDFEKSYQTYGVLRASGIYKKAMLETLTCLYDNDKKNDAKKLKDIMKKDAAFAKVIEDTEKTVLYRELSNFEKRYYGGVLNIFRMLIHKFTGRYERNMKQARKIIRLNGGNEPKITELFLIKDFKKETYEGRLGVYKGGWLEKHGFDWQPCHMNLSSNGGRKKSDAEELEDFYKNGNW